jgi:hypothetical protein
MFTLTIRTGNAAFDDEGRYLAISRLLRQSAKRIGSGIDAGTIQDSNGNTVGEYCLDSATTGRPSE